MELVQILALEHRDGRQSVPVDSPPILKPWLVAPNLSQALRRSMDPSSHRDAGNAAPR